MTNHQSSQKDLLHFSSASLSSVRRNAISKTLANLPYRTISVDTVTAKVQPYPEAIGTESEMEDESRPEYITSSDGGDQIHVDTWNRADDFSFVPYTLREQMNKQNKAKKQRIFSHYASVSSINNSLHGLNNSAHAIPIDLPSTGDEAGISTPRMNTKVSFSNLVDVAIETPGGGQQNVSMSEVTSLTASPNPASALSLTRQIQLATSKAQRIFFVCFHLPVILTHNAHSNEWTATWAESLLAATNGSKIIRDYEAHWIGTISCLTNSIETQKDRDAVTEVLAKINCTPLFLDKETQDAHYHGMCKQVLWPAFHNVDLLDLNTSGVGTKFQSPVRSRATPSNSNDSSDWDQSRLDSWWRAYQDVNQAFADKLAEYLKPGDIMWVHDYHLSLLPKIMDDRECADIGKTVTKKIFLLHIPFPTSQIFRELECGEDILKGMLHADVVGFHAFDHARHFLNATKRILGLNHESLVGGLIGIKIGRKTVLVSMHNVSVEPSQLDGTSYMPFP